MSNTDPQLEFNFASLRPFDEVPRRGSLIKQKAIQVEGSFGYKDPHPEFEGLFYYKRTEGRQQWATLEKCVRYKTADVNWQKENPERTAAKSRRWAQENPEKVAAKARKWRQENPEKEAAMKAKRRKKLKTNIKLHKAAQNALQAVYKLRECLTLCARSAGSTEAFHVDHIWPIMHDKFCGLHAPWNVQILEASENMRKSNSIPTT